MPNHAILVTGFPGRLADHLVGPLATRRPEGTTFFFLVEPRLIFVARRALDALATSAPALRGNWHIIPGDVRQPALGMGNHALERVLPATSEVWHLAALDHSDAPAALAYDTHVEGTLHLLELCERLPNLRRCNILSTAYVAGQRRGRIYEDELDTGQGFNTAYEATKCWAERHVQRRLSDLPISIYRPSLVLTPASATTSPEGPVSSFYDALLDQLPAADATDPHRVAGLLGTPHRRRRASRSRAARRPHLVDTTVNAVPVHWLVEALLHLSETPAALGGTFHLVDPRPSIAPSPRRTVAGAIARAASAAHQHRHRHPNAPQTSTAPEPELSSSPRSLRHHSTTSCKYEQTPQHEPTREDAHDSHLHKPDDAHQENHHNPEAKRKTRTHYNSKAKRKTRTHRTKTNHATQEPPLSAPPLLRSSARNHPSASPPLCKKVNPHPWLLSDLPEVTLRYNLARDAQREWATRSVTARVDALAPLIPALMDGLDALADLIHDENGKPHVEAIGHDVGPSIANARWLFQHAPSLLADRTTGLSWMPNRHATIRREAFGVVLVISPWNMPLSIPMGQILAALVAGNAVVFKPSEHTPRVGDAIGELLEACDLPPNLFSVVQGDGAVGAELVAAQPDKILFTGSVATGRVVMAAAAAFPIPVTLELGGVDALIVCEDADLDLASSAALWGAFFNSGQVCASVERVLIHASVAERFTALLVDKVDRMAPHLDQGRVTMPSQARVYDRHLEDARDRGLDVLRGGTYLAPDRLAPTVVSGEAVLGSRVYEEESFGPLVALATFRTDDHAVRLHNDSPFGLTASVFTRDAARGEAIAERLDVGLVSINDVAGTLHAFGELPWGGGGASGFGRSHGEDGLLDLTRTKVIERTRAGLIEFKRPWWFPYDGSQRETMRQFVRAMGAESPAARVRALATMGRAALAMMVKTPRL